MRLSHVLANFIDVLLSVIDMLQKLKQLLCRLLVLIKNILSFRDLLSGLLFENIQFFDPRFILIDYLFASLA